MAATPEANSCFVLIIQGVLPWAGVVEGIEGVQEPWCGSSGRIRIEP